NRLHLAWSSLVLAIIGSLTAVGWGVYFLSRTPSTGATLFSGPQLADGLPALRWELAVDPLATLFLLLIGGGALIVSLYSFAYLGLVPSSAGKLDKDAHGIAAAYNLIVGAMLLVIVANSVFPLLICLDVMTLAFG